jgi:hypothetical protein
MGPGGSFPRDKSGRGVKLTTHLQLVPRSRKCGSIHPLPICLDGVVFFWYSGWSPWNPHSITIYVTSDCAPSSLPPPLFVAYCVSKTVASVDSNREKLCCQSGSNSVSWRISLLKPRRKSSNYSISISHIKPRGSLAAPQLRRLVTGFPMRWPRFEPRYGHMGFVVDKVALGQVISDYLGFCCQSLFHEKKKGNGC